MPVVPVVLRRGDGLGAQAMMAGGTRAPLLTVAWPSAEMGPMGVERAVRLGMRRELAAVEDEGQRQVLFDELVAAQHARGRALSVATAFEVDDVIDPAGTRATVLQVLASAGPPAPVAGKRVIDTW